MQRPSEPALGASPASSASRRLLWLGLALAMCGVSPAATAEPVALTFPPSQIRLELVAAEDAVQALSRQRPPSVDAGSPAEADLTAYCANGVAQRTTVSKGFFSLITSPILRILLNPVRTRVREELAKYSTLTTSSTTVDFYRGTDAADRAAHLSTRFRCLRFIRFNAESSDSSDTGLDFVGAIGLDPAGDAILLRPLRLYVSKFAVRSATGRYGVVLSLRADAVWREEFVGHQGTVFEQMLVKESVDLGPGSYLKYYGTETREQRVPIVPVSYGIARGRDFGRVDFTLSSAETGAPPATLEFLSELFPPSTETPGHLLFEAALAILPPL